MGTTETDARIFQQQQGLAGVRRFSTALFVLVTLLYVASRWMEARQPGAHWDILAAFAEAAMVGALADWFAVVALFRHPLGIPLPHTAIIPKNRGRIADNIGDFITGNFLRTEVILQRIRAFDPAAKLAEWLSKPESAQLLGAYSTRAMAFAMKAVGDERFLRFAQNTVVSRLERMDFSKLSGELLDVLTQNRRHQELLDGAILQLRTLLSEEETQEKIAALIAREFDSWRKALLGAVKVDELIGTFSARKLVGAVARLLDELDENPRHPVRLRFDHFVAGFTERLKADPGFRRKGEEIRDSLLHSPELTAYLHDLWQQLHAWLESDLQKPESSIRAKVIALTLDLGAKLKADAAMRGWLNEQVLGMAKPICEEHRGNIGRFISSQVKAWDREYMVQQVELNIGKDLQYIRINGTLIGGLVGLLIYAGTLLIKG